MVLLHKLVQSVPRVYVTEFIRARLKEHELESRLLKSRASHFEQLALLHQKHSRAVLEREMYQHANKLSFPSTATIPPRGRVQWKTTATDNALCWVLDAHGKQVRLSLGVVAISELNQYLQAVVVIVDLVLNGEKSAHHTKALQSIYLRACWDEHELESEIRVSPSRCSWDKQSRLLRLKHARATAEIKCYEVVISMEQPSPSTLPSTHYNCVVGFMTLQVTACPLCQKKVTMSGKWMNRTGTSQTRACLLQNDQVGLIYMQRSSMIADLIFQVAGGLTVHIAPPSMPLPGSIWSNGGRFLYPMQLLLYLNFVHMKEQRVIIGEFFCLLRFGWPGALMNAKHSSGHD